MIKPQSISPLAMASPVPVPAGQPVQPQKKKSGCGCTGMVLGCGCVSVLVLMIAGIVGTVMVFWQAPRAVGAEDWGEVVSMVESATRLADNPAITRGGGGDQGGFGFGDQGFSLESLKAMEQGGAPGAQGQSGQGRASQQGAGLDKFYDVLEKPTSSREIRRFQSEMDQWENSKAVRDFQATLERAKELEDAEPGIMVGFQTMRVFTQFAFRANDLGEAYVNHGGGDFMDLHTRVQVLVRVSQMAAGQSGHDPWEQAVADALIEDHDANREEFERTRALVDRATTDPNFRVEDLSEEEQQHLTEAFASQFLMITSAINRDSLQTWASLSDDERKAMIEQANQPHNFIGRALSIAHVDNPEELNVFPFIGF